MRTRVTWNPPIVAPYADGSIEVARVTVEPPLIDAGYVTVDVRDTSFEKQFGKPRKAAPVDPIRLAYVYWYQTKPTHSISFREVYDMSGDGLCKPCSASLASLGRVAADAAAHDAFHRFFPDERSVRFDPHGGGGAKNVSGARARRAKPPKARRSKR